MEIAMFPFFFQFDIICVVFLRDNYHRDQVTIAAGGDRHL